MLEPPPAAVVRVVDVYPYRLAGGGAAEFLLLRRAPGVRYAGQWRMVGGKIEPGETAWQAARRELAEETGRAPGRLWALPSVGAFYEWEADRVNLVPAFAAELAAERDGDPALCREHDAFAWLAPAEAAARLAWPEQRRLLRLAADVLAAGGPGPDLVVPDDSARAGSRAEGAAPVP